MRRLLRVVAAVSAFAWLAAPALADGVILNGISPRSLSRGGTNIGHWDNGAILHDNPAAMANIGPEGMVEVGVLGLFSEFGYSDPDNPGGVSSAAFTPLPQFSYMRRTPDGVWAWGLGVFSEAGFMEKYFMQGPPAFPGPQKYESFGALTKILPGISGRLTENLTMGATLGVGISHVEFEGPYTLNGPALPGTPTLVDVRGTGAAPVWSVGFQYLVTESTTVGVTYLSASDFELHGRSIVTLPGFPGSSNFDSELDITWPQSVGVGVRHQIDDIQAVSCDVIWFDWSGAFDTLDLRLRNPTNPFFPPVDESIPLGWRDTVSVRVGYERDLDIGGTLRLGYVHHRNPIPDGTLTPFIQGTLEHAVSAGYGWTSGDWEIDFGYMFLFGPTQTVGTSALAGGDFSGSTHDAAIHAVFLGFTKPL
jgi:long-chain fatty acid transport protein